MIHFTVKWLEGKNLYGFITSDIVLIHLCYVKLALKEKVEDIVKTLRSFPLSISTEQQFGMLAQKILDTYKHVK